MSTSTRLLLLLPAWASAALLQTPACPGTAASNPRAAVRCGASLDPAEYDPEKGGLSTLTTERPEGSHGTGYRFMPLSSMSKEPAPALVCIAGAYPGLTADQLLAPQALPFAPAGRWNYHVLRGDVCSTGFVALPGSSLLDSHPNTVAVVCDSYSLGLEFADGQQHEVLALIDRSDIAALDASQHDDQTFYAFADEAGAVQIRWLATVPAGWRILGRLLYAQMPYIHRPGSAGGFAEDSDEFEF
uniref:Rubisco accumulation factor 1 C-terminal domain-containing protein n=1 Tax=Haptolina brevifila TaxID=156173 RepID=A0A7S2D8L0_9EUKA